VSNDLNNQIRHPAFRDFLNDSDRIHVGIQWLESVAFGHVETIGKKVLIIGVGNTAMDCCRTSLRLGADDVKVMARKPRGFFKASDWELEDAEEERVEIVVNHSPREFVLRDGKLVGMNFDLMDYDIDDNGRIVESRVVGEKFFPCDDVVLAIGQDNAFPWIERDLGIEFDRWEVPVVDPADKEAVTYRTHRISRELQIWLVEGRDFRSPNGMEDGPAKTLWGKEQIAWLKRTLLESDAPFKILISPTAMVGPDGATKRDSHVNIGGFQHEAREFFGWLERNSQVKRNFYLICGDRHWQYHAIHPGGVEEFACGALCDPNAFAAISPGDPNSTDPEGRIIHKYTQRGQSGGFLRVRVHPAAADRPAQAEFAFYDELGALLYRTLKFAREP